jgi:hypothetical protein
MNSDDLWKNEYATNLCLSGWQFSIFHDDYDLLMNDVVIQFTLQTHSISFSRLAANKITNFSFFFIKNIFFKCVPCFDVCQTVSIWHTSEIRFRRKPGDACEGIIRSKFGQDSQRWSNVHVSLRLVHHKTNADVLIVKLRLWGRQVCCFESKFEYEARLKSSESYTFRELLIELLRWFTLDWTCDTKSTLIAGVDLININHSARQRQ